MTKCLALAAALTGALIASQALAQPAPRQCFSQRDIQGVVAVDDFTVNLRTALGEVYQAKTDIPCPDVGFGAALAYRSFSNRICSPNDMSFVTRGAFSPRDCPLKSLRRLTAEEVAALPKRARP